MDRQPAVAGRFYPGAAETLIKDVRKYLDAAEAASVENAKLVMLPHAGYVFSGPTAGKTLGRTGLENSVLLLGPNHTGRGTPFSLRHRGKWLLPDGGLDVDESLADALLAADSRIRPDETAHEAEHSLEVLAPFIRAVNPEAKIAPMAVAERNAGTLFEVAANMTEVLMNRSEPTSIVVSSDMTHFLSDDAARKQDRLALERIEAMDPPGLLQTVAANRITMCGVLPMTMGLDIAKRLGATRAEVADYSTSAEASGDYNRVVGYAGVLVY